MEEILKIGVVDDDEIKVTQIITRLIQGIDGATPEKRARYSQYQFVPIEVNIKDNLEEMIKHILELELDCLLIDYKLSSYENVDYTGTDLAKAVDKVLFEFPLFILTSYDDDLFSNEIFNAYQVFDFYRYLNEDQERVELHFKMIEQILKTQKQKEEWERQLRKLLPLAGTSDDIDSRILELDSKLERSMDGGHALTDKARKDLSSNKLNELLEMIDKLLDKE